MSTKTIRLQPVTEHGWRMGFANVFRKENGEWWGTRNWLWQTLLWLGIVNGILAAVLWAPPSVPPDATEEQRRRLETLQETAPPRQETGIQVLFIVGGMATGVGVIIIAQGAILDEKQSGTLAWVLSKPVTRTAFFVAKLLANGIAIILIMVVLQCAVAYIQLSLAGEQALPLLPFLGGALLMGLYLLFFLTLTLMLSAVSNHRGVAIGVPMGLNFGYQFIAGVAPWLGEIMPFRLVLTVGQNQPALAVSLVMQQSITSLLPIIATVVWIVVFIVIGLWKFRRIEF